MTLPPLLIAAENGDILFYSGVRRRDARITAIRTACAAQPRGILQIGETRVYVKPVTLGGKTYYFFMDFERLCACYGVDAAPRAAEGLFDVSAFSKANAVPRSLGALTQLFESAYAAILGDGDDGTVHFRIELCRAMLWFPSRRTPMRSASRC